MDIRNWPLDRIMQLPDHCFGRRWPVGLQATLSDAAAVFDISEAALPEGCVIWELAVIEHAGAMAMAEVCLALGDQLPVSDAIFGALEVLFPGVESRAGWRGAIEPSTVGTLVRIRMRFPVKASGRRVVGRFIRTQGTSTGVQVILVVSSIPTEVPDWLISAKV